MNSRSLEMIFVDKPSDLRAAQILSDAFHDDPVLSWISQSSGFVPAFFEMILPTFIDKGLTYLDPQERGAAAWLRPGDELKWPLDLVNLWRMTRRAGPRGAYRLARGGQLTEKYHPRKAHYYLFAIGARAANRGQGVGSGLISHVLRRCDQENMPAYLENSKEANLAFYQGHGFEVQREIRFAESAPPIWLMWREPSPSVETPLR